MGSLGDEELEKLVIDYIESPFINTDHIDKSPPKILTNLQEILGEKGEKEKEIEEKIKGFIERKRLSYEGDDKKRDVMKKIIVKLRSDGYDASISRTSWDFSFDRREGCRVFRYTGKYEYIDVMVTCESDGDDVSKKRIIIDLDFKSQFELVKQTKAYKDMTQMLPKVFVATEERLKRVVTLVCRGTKESLKEEGMYRPPWRTVKYMQAKWLSENRRRVSASKRSSCSYVFDGDDDDDDDDEEKHEGGSLSGRAVLKTSCCLPIF